MLKKLINDDIALAHKEYVEEIIRLYHGEQYF